MELEKMFFLYCPKPGIQFVMGHEKKYVEMERIGASQFWYVAVKHKASEDFQYSVGTVEGKKYGFFGSDSIKWEQRASCHVEKNIQLIDSTENSYQISARVYSEFLEVLFDSEKFVTYDNLVEFVDLFSTREVTSTVLRLLLSVKEDVYRLLGLNILAKSNMGIKCVPLGSSSAVFDALPKTLEGEERSKNLLSFLMDLAINAMQLNKSSWLPILHWPFVDMERLLQVRIGGMDPQEFENSLRSLTRNVLETMSFELSIGELLLKVCPENLNCLFVVLEYLHVTNIFSMQEEAIIGDGLMVQKLKGVLTHYRNAKATVLIESCFKFYSLKILSRTKAVVLELFTESISCCLRETHEWKIDEFNVLIKFVAQLSGDSLVLILQSVLPHISTNDFDVLLPYIPKDNVISMRNLENSLKVVVRKKVKEYEDYISAPLGGDGMNLFLSKCCQLELFNLKALFLELCNQFRLTLQKIPDEIIIGFAHLFPDGEDVRLNEFSEIFFNRASLCIDERANKSLIQTKKIIEKLTGISSSSPLHFRNFMSIRLVRYLLGLMNNRINIDVSGVSEDPVSTILSTESFWLWILENTYHERVEAFDDIQVVGIIVRELRTFSETIENGAMRVTRFDKVVSSEHRLTLLSSYTRALGLGVTDGKLKEIYWHIHQKQEEHAVIMSFVQSVGRYLGAHDVRQYEEAIDAKWNQFLLGDISTVSLGSSSFWGNLFIILSAANSVSLLMKSLPFLEFLKMHARRSERQEISVNDIIVRHCAEACEKFSNIFIDFWKIRDLFLEDAVVLFRSLKQEEIEDQLHLICQFMKTTHDIETPPKLYNALVSLIQNFLSLELWSDRIKTLVCCLEMLSIHIPTFLRDSKEIMSDYCGKKGGTLIAQLIDASVTVQENTQKLSDSAWDIIVELGKSEELFNMLSGAWRDENLDVLIDAVEDHGDSIVNEATVSDLLKVKTSLVKLTQKDLTNFDQFIDVLLEITSQEQQGDHLNARIHNCSTNLQSLVRLYGSLANRGEMTKDIIQNALSFGVFSLACKAGELEMCLAYKRDSSETRLSNQELQDLRSRALLVTASESSKMNEQLFLHMKRFVEIVDLLNDIVEIGRSLTSVPNDYRVAILSHRQFKASDPEIENQLKDRRQKLYKIYLACETAIQKARDVHPMLNFFSPSQIWEIHSFLSLKVADHRNAQKNRVLDLFLLTGRQFREIDIMMLPQIDPFSGSSDGFITALDELGNILGEYLTRLPVLTRPTGPFFREPQLSKYAHWDSNTDFMTNSCVTISVVEDPKSIMQVMFGYFFSTGFLPLSNQVLYCHSKMTEDELLLILYRAFNSSELHCIIGVEKLDAKVQEKFVRSLEEKVIRSSSSDNNQTNLVIICQIGSLQQQIIDKLTALGSKHEKKGIPDDLASKFFHLLFDTVCCVTSSCASLGKTQLIHEMAHQQRVRVKYVPIFGEWDPLQFIKRLRALNLTPQDALHINLDLPLNTDCNQLNWALFELVTTGILRSGDHHVILPRMTGSEDRFIRVYVEVVNREVEWVNEKIPICKYFLRRDLVWDWNRVHISPNVFSQIQIVSNYLNARHENFLTSKDIVFKKNGELNDHQEKAKVLPSGKCRELLSEVFAKEPNMSFTILNVFVSVLANQLRDFSQSSYFRVHHLKQMTTESGSVRNFLFDSLVNVALEFATRSVTVSRIKQHQNILNTEEEEQFQLKSFSESNHLIVAFQSLSKSAITSLYIDKSVVPQSIKELMRTQLHLNENQDPLKDFSLMGTSDLIHELEKLIRTTKLDNYPLNYALTISNLVKMALIVLRIRARIPIIIIGETGCGKTSLIHFLAHILGVEFRVLNIHAGVTEENITSFVEEAEKFAIANPDRIIWLFFDEINTNPLLGLICDITCHRSMFGKPIHRNIVPICAANPYRKRPKENIASAGLKIKAEHLLKDPLAQLVYRVYPLPESCLELVWDYGTLTDQEELTYIRNMVGSLPHSEVAIACITRSQIFSRLKRGKSSVSLRDVARCLHLYKWFSQNLVTKKEHRHFTADTTVLNFDKDMRALVLALAHCYYVCLSRASLRQEYRNEISQCFPSGINSVSAELFQNILEYEQIGYLEQMELPAGIAKNTSLMENVFVLLVCILNVLPVFLIGKPGNSKSLAMQLIRTNLRGKDSKNDFLKKLKQVYVISYQGSESSTSEGILAVFEKAVKYQQRNPDVITVVLLDEIGLAEISKHNPLKVLHKIMEPPLVAIVGISNWELDDAKMNRAIILQRPEPDENDLMKTAEAIQEGCGSGMAIHGSDLRSIVRAYHSYYDSQDIKCFHGLRDFYSLIKSLCRKKTGNFLTALLHEIDRNFGGNPKEMRNIRDIFLYHWNRHVYDLSSANVLNLIFENIEDRLARHLMVISNGDMALRVLETHLRKRGTPPVVLYGSHFIADDCDDYRYRILSDIILHMENGRTTILKGLKSIYGSLYDMLNQNYSVVGGKKHCRIALGPYSNPMCYVHDAYRCIVLEDQTEVRKSDPPLLNRFEKQCMTYEYLFTPDDREVLNELAHFVKEFTSVTSTNGSETFDEYSVIPGFSLPLLQSLVLMVRNNAINGPLPVAEHLELCKQKLMKLVFPDGAIRSRRSRLESKESEKYLKIFWKESHMTLLDAAMHFSGNVEESNYGERVIAYTFDTIYQNFADILKEKLTEMRVYCEKVATFQSERHFSDYVKRVFYSGDKQAVFILQCNAAADFLHMGMCKYLIDHISNEYYANPDSPHFVRHCIITIHLNRELHGIKATQEEGWKFDYLSGWKLISVDSLLPGFATLDELQDKTVVQILRGKSNLCFDRVLEQVLLWCFTCIKYPETERDVVSRIQDLQQKILESKGLKHVLREVVCGFLESQGEDDWQCAIACDPRQLRLNSTLVNAICEQVRSFVRQPLAKIIFASEKHQLISGLINHLDAAEKQGAEMEVIFRKVIEKLINISNLNSSTYANGLGCFDIKRSLVPLKVPFSITAVEFVNKNFRSLFLDRLSVLKERGDDEDLTLVGSLIAEQRNEITTALKDQLPTVDISDSTFVSSYLADFLLLSIPNVAGSFFEECMVVMRSQMNSNKVFLIRNEDDVDESSKLMQSVLSITSAADCHILWWVNESDILSQINVLSSLHSLKLSENKLLDVKDKFMKSTKETNIDRAIMDVIGRCVFPTESMTELFGGVIQWNRFVCSLLSQMRRKNAYDSPIYHALRVCTDFVSTLGVSDNPDCLNRIQTELISISTVIQEEEFEIHCIHVLDTILENCKKLVSDLPILSSYVQRFVTDFSIRCLEVPTIDLDLDLVQSLLDEVVSPNSLIVFKTHSLSRVLVQISESHEDGAFRNLISFSDRIGDANLGLLQEWLENLGDIQHPLCVLFCDILETEKLVSAENDVPTFSLFENSVAHLLAVEQSFINPDIVDEMSHGYPLRTLCAIAYIRSSLHLIAEMLTSVEYSNSDLAALLPSTLRLLAKNSHFAYALRVFLLKGMRNQGLSVEEIRDISGQFGDEIGSLHWMSDLPWRTELSPVNRLGYSPYISLRVSEDADRAFDELGRGQGRVQFTALCQNISSQDNSDWSVVMQLIFERIYIAYHNIQGLSQNEARACEQMQNVLVEFVPHIQDAQYRIMREMMTNFETFQFLQILPDNQGNLHLVIAIVRFIIYVLTNGRASPFWFYTLDSLATSESLVLSCPSDETEILLAAVNDIKRTYRCQNGHIFGIGDCGQPMETGFCPTCRVQIGGLHHQPLEGTVQVDVHVNDTFGMIEQPIDQLRSISSTLRTLTPLNFRMLHFLVTCCSLLSSLLSRSVDYMKHIDHLENDWQVIKALLNADDEQVGIAFHHLILRIGMRENLNRSGVLKSSQSRLAWENSFGELGDQISRNLNDFVREAREMSSSSNRDEGVTLQQEIDEVVVFPNEVESAAYEKRMLAHLLRRRGVPSKLSLRSSYYSDPTNLEKYPLINIVYQWTEQPHSLENMKYLVSFLEWIRTVNSKLEFQVKRGEATQMSISDFLKQNNENDEDLKLFEQFKDGWNKTKDLLDTFECEELPKVPSIDENCSISLCALENRDMGAILCTFLKMFATIQNGFLDKLLDLSAQGLRALLPLQIGERISAIPKVSILEAKSSHVVRIAWNAIDSLCYADSRYKHGGEFFYDYDRLQLFWGGNIINKCMLLSAVNFPQTFRYASEPFFDNMLLLQTVEAAISQKMVPSDLRDRIEKDPVIQAEAALRALDVVLYFLDKTKPNPEMTIHDFCSLYLSKHDFQGLEGTCLLNVHLFTIVGVYEIVEQMVSFKTVDSTPETYKEDLPPHISQYILRQIQENTINLADLITALNRYLFRFLSTTLKEPTEPLRNSLGVCWPDQTLLENQWNSEVPIGEAEIQHTFALRSLVMLEHERLQKEKARRLRVNRVYGKAAASVKQGQAANPKTRQPRTSDY